MKAGNVLIDILAQLLSRSQSVYNRRSVTKPHGVGLLSLMHRSMRSGIHEYVNSVTEVKVTSAARTQTRWHATERSSVCYDLTRRRAAAGRSGRVGSERGTPSAQLTDHLSAYEVPKTMPRRDGHDVWSPVNHRQRQDVVAHTTERNCWRDISVCLGEYSLALYLFCINNNNNNDNNNNFKTMFMVLSLWQSHCESSPGSFDECRTAPSGRRPKTKPDDLGCESVCTGCQSLHPPSPSIIITQPENRYSFYRPTEDRQRWFTRLQTVTHHSTNRV